MDQSRGKRGNLLQAYRNVTLAEKLAFCAVVLFALATLIYCAGRGDLTKHCPLPFGHYGNAGAAFFWSGSSRCNFPHFLKCLSCVILPAVQFWGSVFEFYYLFADWDTLLHVICGFLMGMVGYMAPAVLNRDSYMRISGATRILSALTFSLAAAVVWEFCEYAMDTFLNFDMQCDTVVHSIKSYLVGESPLVVDTIDNITEVTINGVLSVWTVIWILATLIP